jgi:hypothetical protein
VIVSDVVSQKTVPELVQEIRNLLPALAATGRGGWGGGGRARDRVDLMLDLLQEQATPKPGASVGPEAIRYEWRMRSRDGTFTEWVDCSLETIKKLTGKRIEKRALGVIEGFQP